MTSFWKQLLLCAVLIGAAGLFWHHRDGVTGLWNASAASVPQRQTRAEGTPVIVAQTVSLQDDRSLSTIGTGFALRSVTLRAPASGAITEFSIAPGRRFAEDDVLMRLEDADERFAISLAQARLEQARDERDRFSRLQGSGVASASRLEEVQTNFQLAKIEFDRAQENLSNRVLRAPFDGITGLASVEIGDRIATGDIIGTFDDRSSILVEFDLPEALLGRVSIGLEVAARTPSVEGRKFTGTISAIDSRINVTTRTARVRVTIDNSADLLRPGGSFAIELDLPGDTFPAVPELALQFAKGALHVWRVTDGTAEQVEVRLVRRRAGLVIVDGPLTAGDLVVVEGTQRLRGAGRVLVLNAPQEPRT